MYWTKRAEGFAEQRIHEYHSVKHDRWLKEFDRYLPKDRKLRVLDLGTGTGFFAFLLSAEGHQVTGVDLTQEMIDKAKESAGVLGLEAEFYQMDAEEPDFPDESFDVLVTRNLTWTMPHLDKAYRSWYKLLKPGGVLINFDADYGTALEDEEEVVLPENHAHKLISKELSKANEWITSEVHSYHQPRPQWDVQLLRESGFERIVVDYGVWKRIYAEIDEFYNPTPIFTIAAFKGEE